MLFAEAKEDFQWCRIVTSDWDGLGQVFRTTALLWLPGRKARAHTALGHSSSFSRSSKAELKGLLLRCAPTWSLIAPEHRFRSQQLEDHVAGHEKCSAFEQNDATVVLHNVLMNETTRRLRGTWGGGLGVETTSQLFLPADLTQFCVRWCAIAQVTEEGNLECLYHGWQFEGAGGSCTKIPQVGAKMMSILVFNNGVLGVGPLSAACCCCRPCAAAFATHKHNQWGRRLTFCAEYAGEVKLSFVLRLTRVNKIYKTCAPQRSKHARKRTLPFAFGAYSPVARNRQNDARWSWS